jgi:hypothetical protein
MNGAEKAILAGGRSLLSREIIEVMLIEAAGTEEDRQGARGQIESMLGHVPPMS